ncbi:MAG: hypothetical protein RJB38_1068 [Pseudomonadota bacterium]|jgi:hypothetical protein
MSEAQTTATPKSKLSRANVRALGRKKRKAKLSSNKEVAKAYFEAKSKRSAEKKTAFRKKKSKKK